MEPVVSIRNVNYWYGAGALRRQVLFDVSTDIMPGEIILLTGPSGSGKTTILTLAGALRAVEEGSVRIFGKELKGASASLLREIRARVGFVFQAHNLLQALTARQNVQLGLGLEPNLRRDDAEKRSLAALESVGLGEHSNKLPSQLSGGQKQRVAIARAIVRNPGIILADEPTASLDRQSGRDIAELLQNLAKQQGTTILLVTHDTRILDLADRVLVLEDGRMESLAASVVSSTGSLLQALTRLQSRDDLSSHVSGLSSREFLDLVEQIVAEFDQFVRVFELGRQTAVQEFTTHFVDVVTVKIKELMGADRATLFLYDAKNDELESRIALGDGGKRLDIRIPASSGIAGRVFRTKLAENIRDPYGDPDFNPDIDRRLKYRTENILCMPLLDNGGGVFGVAQLLNRRAGVFTAQDEKEFQGYSEALAVILQSSRIMENLRVPEN